MLASGILTATGMVNAVNAGMATQIEGRRLALRPSLRPQIFGWLVGWSS